MRRPSSSTARRSHATRAPSRRSRSTSAAGEHLLAVVVHPAPPERAAGRRDEPGARAQEPDGLRLGLLPAACPSGDLAAGDARRAAGGLPGRDARGRLGTVEIGRRGRAPRRVARSSGGRTGWASSISTTSSRGVGFRVGFREVTLRRLRAASSTASGAGPGLELGADRRALRRAAAREARAPARARGAREREPAPRLGRRPDRDAGVLRALRPARPARLAGVQPVELRNRQQALGRPGVRRADGRRGAPRSSRAGAGTPRSRSGAAATSSTATTRRRCSPRCARSCTSSTPSRAWLPTSPLGRSGRARAVGAPGPAGAQRALRHAHVAAAQRVRRRGDDEPPRARGADRPRSTAGRPTARTRSTSTSARGGTTRRSSRRRSAAGSRTSTRCAARASGCSTRGSATRSRRRCAAAPGTIPWQFNEPYPNAWCTTRRRPPRRPEARLLGRRARVPRRRRARGSRRAAWGGLDEARATVDGAGAVRRPRRERRRRGGGGELAAPLDAFAARRLRARPRQGANRYVMTRTENLAPLLDLHRRDRDRASAQATARRSGNVGPVAALGVVLEDARPYDEPGWVTFSDNVLDLLPGETREIELGGPGRRAARRGLECSQPRALAPDGSPVDGLPLRRRRASPTKAPSRSRPGSASSSRCRRPATRAGSSRASSTARTGPRAARGSTRASRRAASTSSGWSPTRGPSAPTAARRRRSSRDGRGLVTSEVSPLGQAGVGFA